eukprot:374991-Pyramimonas_sp.AAC.1
MVGGDRGVDFLKPEMCANATILGIMKQVLTMMEDVFEQTIASPSLLKIMTLELLKMCFVWTEGDGDCVSKHYIFTTAGTTAKLLEYLTFRMAGSTLYKAAADGKKRKATSDKNPKEKKAAKAKGKPKFKVADEVMSLSTGVAERQKYWLDDLSAAILNPLSDLPEDAFVKPALREAVRTGLEFCFLGTVNLAGVVVTSWKAVRKDIRAGIIRAHADELLLAHHRAGAAAAASSKELADEMLRSLDERDKLEEAQKLRQDAEARGQSPACTALQSMLEDQTFAGRMVTFISANIGKQVPLQMTPACRDMMLN